jgi:hypothetical protein
MVNRRDLQINVDSEPWWGPGILHILKVLSLANVKSSISEQKNLQTDLTGDQTQNPMNERPVSYPETIR